MRIPSAPQRGSNAPTPAPVKRNASRWTGCSLSAFKPLLGTFGPRSSEFRLFCHKPPVLTRV
eukprot:2031268-Lingulodinium_polyedra.AAC.1